MAFTDCCFLVAAMIRLANWSAGSRPRLETSMAARDIKQRQKRGCNREDRKERRNEFIFFLKLGEMEEEQLGHLTGWVCGSHDLRDVFD